MKALVLKEYKKFSFEEVPEPQVQPQEVLVAVKACVSGTATLLVKAATPSMSRTAG